MIPVMKHKALCSNLIHFMHMLGFIQVNANFHAMHPELWLNEHGNIGQQLHVGAARPSGSLARHTLTGYVELFVGAHVGNVKHCSVPQCPMDIDNFRPLSGFMVLFNIQGSAKVMSIGSCRSSWESKLV
jgi:hypothetical protein